MGLRLRGNTWFLRKNIDGQRVEVTTGYAKADKAKAVKAAAKIVSRLLDEKHGLAPKPDAAPKVPTLAAWWKTYRRIYSTKKSKPGHDARIMETWLALPRTDVVSGEVTTWGETPLDQFRQSDCMAAVDARAASLSSNPRRKVQTPLSAGTVRRERGFIQSVFERAIEDHLIEKNPWRGIKRGKDDVRRRLLMPGDEAKLMAALSPKFQRFVQFLIETGLRLEGLRTLEPRLVFPDHIHVSEKSPKHLNICGVCKRQGRKCRDVPLTTKARAFLDVQLTEPQWDTATREMVTGRLWTQNPQRLREVLAIGAEKAGILNSKSFPHGNLSPHDLRHTFGHRWLKKGGDIYALSKILGHSSVAVTEKHYAYLLKEDLSAAMRKVMEPAAATA